MIRTSGCRSAWKPRWEETQLKATMRLTRLGSDEDRIQVELVAGFGQQNDERKKKWEARPGVVHDEATLTELGSLFAADV